MQRRYWEYDADDKTIDLSAFLLGVHPPGLYRGFDFVPTADMTLRLDHATTGFRYTDINKVQSSLTGMLKTPQGVLIHEDEAVTLSLQPANSSNPRIDLVVCTHEYVEISGGAQAIYEVITGSPSSNPVAPQLSSPNIQVAIGQVIIPAGVTALNKAGVVYTRSEPPFFANKQNVRLNGGQTIEGLKKFSTIPEAAGRKVLTEAYREANDKSGDDFDTITTPGFYHWDSNATNKNDPKGGSGQRLYEIHVISPWSSRIIQVAYEFYGFPSIYGYVRQYQAHHGWSGWVMFMDRNGIGNKVDKVSGKALSTNDLTNDLLDKLSNIAENANNYQHPSSHSIGFISGLTDALANKVDKVSGKGLSTNDLTDDLLNQLKGVTSDVSRETGIDGSIQKTIAGNLCVIYMVIRNATGILIDTKRKVGDLGLVLPRRQSTHVFVPSTAGSGMKIVEVDTNGSINVIPEQTNWFNTDWLEVTFTVVVS